MKTEEVERRYEKRKTLKADDVKCPKERGKFLHVLLPSTTYSRMSGEGHWRGREGREGEAPSGTYQKAGSCVRIEGSASGDPEARKRTTNQPAAQ